MYPHCSRVLGFTYFYVLLFAFAVPSEVHAQEPGRVQLFGHVGSANAAVFSPDGTLAATASNDDTVKIFQTASGVLLRTFGLFDDVNAVAFTPNGNRIVTGSADNTARLWNLATGRQIHTFNHQGDVTSVAVSTNGTLLVTGSEDNSAVLWNIASGEKLTTFQHDDDVQSVDFSPNGLQIITGVADGSAFLWDITTVLNPEATLTPTSTVTPTPTHTPTPTNTPSPTETAIPTPTFTNTPLIPPTPTNSPTPIASPTPVIPERSPVFSFSFNSVNEFGREPGGFGSLPEGMTTVGPIPGNPTDSSNGFGGIITTAPGQVELLTFPQVEVEDELIAVRLTVRTTAPNATLTLAVIDSAGDGTLSLNTQVDSGQHVDNFSRMVALIQPKSRRVFPVFQVANIPGSQTVTTYIDELEIFVLPKDSNVRNSFLAGE